jgi:hypothetical protein
MTRPTIAVAVVALVLCAFVVGLAAASAADATRPHKGRPTGEEPKAFPVTFKTYLNGTLTDMEVQVWPQHNYSGNPVLKWFWTGPTPAGVKTVLMQPGQYTAETRNPSGLTDFVVPTPDPVTIRR